MLYFRQTHLITYLALALLCLSLSACLRKPDPLPTRTPAFQVQINTAIPIQPPTPLPTYAEPTATSIPTATTTAEPGKLPMPTLIAVEQIKIVADDQRAEHPWVLSDLIKKFEDPKLSAPLQYEVTLSGTGLIWDNWWCAIDENTLNTNLSSMRFEYQVNGQALSPTQAHRYFQKLTGTSMCQVTMFAFDGLAAGQHILNYAFLLDAPLSDGLTQFSAGRYETQILVNVGSGQ
ncbi:MAG TPA: hypothetical protein PK299_06115 [Anaerolineales bacterium]|nr:hypothetical protein [Anaerolineales bacterium]